MKKLFILSILLVCLTSCTTKNDKTSAVKSNSPIAVASADSIISDELNGRKKIIVQGIEFIDYGSLTPVLNFCPVCKRYCLDKCCGECGAKQPKYRYDLYCPKCNERRGPVFDYCTTCGTHVLYRKVERE